MRKNFGSKPICYPQPVFILATYNPDGTADAMNAAWGGIHNDDEIFICLGSDHQTTKNILERKAFTISMATVETMAACDYVGLVSGKKEPQKFYKAGFHGEKSEFVDAPLIQELPMALECTLVSYDEASCCLVAKIVNVSADQSVLNESGKIDPQKLHPITFDPMNNAYLPLGAPVGKAFHDGMALKNL